jgi:hypothetical protein
VEVSKGISSKITQRFQRLRLALQAAAELGPVRLPCTGYISLG